MYFDVSGCSIERIAWRASRQGRQFESGHRQRTTASRLVFSVMTYFVYILYSKSHRRFYSGYTQELKNRLREHNGGETKSIIPYLPYELVWSKEVTTRSQAMKIEKEIKSRGAERFLQNCGIYISKN